MGVGDYYDWKSVPSYRGQRRRKKRSLACDRWIGTSARTRETRDGNDFYKVEESSPVISSLLSPPGIGQKGHPYICVSDQISS